MDNIKFLGKGIKKLLNSNSKKYVLIQLYLCYNQLEEKEVQILKDDGGEFENL